LASPFYTSKIAIGEDLRHQASDNYELALNYLLSLSLSLFLRDGKCYHNVHAHTTGTGGNGCTTKVCIINREQHVKEREG
jgi:hypothetical protein